MLSGKYICITIGDVEIDLSRSKKTVTKPKAGSEVNILGIIRPAPPNQLLLTHSVVEGLSSDLAEFFPEGLSINFKNAMAAEQKLKSGSKGHTTTTKTKVMAANIGAKMPLSDLPVIGKLLPDIDLTLDDLQLIMASAVLGPSQVEELNDIMPPGISHFPDLLRKGTNFAIQISIGDLTLSYGSTSKNLGVTTSLGDPDVVTQTATSYTPPPTAWITLNKSIGSLHLAAIGIRLGINGSFEMLVNASVKLGKLTLTMLDLGLTFPLPKLIDLPSHLSIKGMSMSYVGKNVSMAGMFLHSGGTWDGAFSLKLSKMQISAIGSYAQDPHGNASVFIYALLQRPIGGPAFCYVEGLAATFGYNRNFIAPPVNEIADFPLIKAASGGTGMPMTPAGMQKVMTDIKDYIAPADGENFIGIGLKFSTYKVVNSFALLVVKFGQEVAVDLLGESTYIAPSPKAKKKVAQVELELVGSYHPDAETLMIRGQLTPASYVISPKCHLQGAFAIGNWFKTGDFVYTLGGYAKNYTIPPNYPKHVPQLGFLWQIDPNISIKGGGYWAITPDKVMLGGYLIAAFTSDWVRASFEIDADFEVEWSPFHYDGSFNVTFSLSVRIDLLFCSEWIGFDLSRRLNVWGPPFGGEVSISLAVATVHIYFGADPDPDPLLSGPDFYSHHMPQPATSGSQAAMNPLVSLNIEDGLIKEISDDESQINPKDLSFTTNSFMPCTTLSPTNGPSNSELTFEVVPMGVVYGGSDGALTSAHTVSITCGGLDATASFVFRPISKESPTSMWQTGNLDKPSSAPLIPLYFGYQITATPSVEGVSEGPIPEAVLAVETFQGKPSSDADAYAFSGDREAASKPSVSAIDSNLYSDLCNAFDITGSFATEPVAAGLKTRLQNIGTTEIFVGTLSND